MTIRNFKPSSDEEDNYYAEGGVVLEDGGEVGSPFREDDPEQDCYEDPWGLVSRAQQDVAEGVTTTHLPTGG